MGICPQKNRSSSTFHLFVAILSSCVTSSTYNTSKDDGIFNLLELSLRDVKSKNRGHFLFVFHLSVLHFSPIIHKCRYERLDSVEQSGYCCSFLYNFSFDDLCTYVCILFFFSCSILIRKLKCASFLRNRQQREGNVYHDLCKYIIQ